MATEDNSRSNLVIVARAVFEVTPNSSDGKQRDYFATPTRHRIFTFAELAYQQPTPPLG